LLGCRIMLTSSLKHGTHARILWRSLVKFYEFSQRQMSLGSLILKIPDWMLFECQSPDAPAICGIETID
jgi:hypothetical protein